MQGGLSFPHPHLIISHNLYRGSKAHPWNFPVPFLDTRYKLEGHTVLYIPAEAIKMDPEVVVKDKELVQRLESEWQALPGVWGQGRGWGKQLQLLMEELVRRAHNWEAEREIEEVSPCPLQPP